MPPEPLTGSARRLAEELDEDGIVLDEHDGVRRQLLDELDHARRIPMFEGRRPLYGSFSMPPGTDIAAADGVVDLVSLEGMPLDMARTFSDGRSAFVVHRHEASPVLVCFDRPVQYEADLVRVQQGTGARIVQRTLVLGQVRLFTEQRVVSWDGRSWTDRPTALSLLPALRRCAPDLDPAVAHGMLDFVVHWLSPARAGATLVIHEEGLPWPSLDVATKLRAPRLSITNRQHFPALFASMLQHDLATLVTADGSVEFIGVGLRATVEAERDVESHLGMRHRSAQRFSYDHPTTTIAVVSDNGPVTIFRAGQALGLTIDR